MELDLLALSSQMAESEDSQTNVFEEEKSKSLIVHEADKGYEVIVFLFPIQVPQTYLLMQSSSYLKTDLYRKVFILRASSLIGNDGKVKLLAKTD